MKKLSQFFDWDRFSKDKVFMVTGCRVWKEYNTENVKGTCVDTVIARDETVYEQKDGEQVSNLYERATFKVPKTINIPANTYVVASGVKATVYGKYHNDLSIKCQEIQILQQKKEG